MRAGSASAVAMNSVDAPAQENSWYSMLGFLMRGMVLYEPAARQSNVGTGQERISRSDRRGASVGLTTRKGRNWAHGVDGASSRNGLFSGQTRRYGNDGQVRIQILV